MTTPQCRPRSASPSGGGPAGDLARTYRAQGHELIYQPGNPLDTRYNATFLHAVMGNLLRNALHYTEHGFIRLTLEPTGFVVEDSGVGIPEDKREAMFEPFVRGNEKRGDGLGLGLSLVQRICESQGWVRQPQYHGAQWLPLPC
jgi:signal transduction histidine kinase